MMDTYMGPWRKYVEFSGRAGRSEFWTFTLLNGAILLVLLGLASQIGILKIVYVLFALALILPSLAVGIRRLHDLGRSGWWWLLDFVPFGGIVLLVWFCMAGNKGDNRFGPESSPAVAVAVA